MRSPRIIQAGVNPGANVHCGREDSERGEGLAEAGTETGARRDTVRLAGGRQPLTGARPPEQSPPSLEGTSPADFDFGLLDSGTARFCGDLGGKPQETSRTFSQVCV